MALSTSDRLRCPLPLKRSSEQQRPRHGFGFAGPLPLLPSRFDRRCCRRVSLEGFSSSQKFESRLSTYPEKKDSSFLTPPKSSHSTPSESSTCSKVPLMYSMYFSLSTSSILANCTGLTPASPRTL